MTRISIRTAVATAVLLIVIGTVAIEMNRSSGIEKIRSNIAACKKDEAQRRSCFNELVMSDARAGGVARGLDTLTQVYALEPEFIEDCHIITHDLGALSFEAFKEGKDFTLSQKASSCGFGYYHGFMEAMLAANGDLSEAKRFCEYVDEKMQSSSGNISAACYHGIGHGFVDGSDEERWGDEDKFIERGLTLCAALGKIDSDTEHLTRCASGVFNSLAIAYLNPKYRLFPDRKDPFAICKRQVRAYEKTACYDQMNGYLSHTFATFSDALRAVNASAEPTYRLVAIRSLATSEANIYLTSQNGRNEKGKTAELGECSVALKEYREACAKGFGVGLIEVGDPTHGYENAVAICAKDAQFRNDCLEGVAQAAHDWAPKSRQREVCALIKTANADSGRFCERVIEGRGM